MTMKRAILALGLACLLPAAAWGEEGRAPAEQAVVRHVPPAEAAERTPLRLAAIIDDAWVEAGLVARYRRAGSKGMYSEAAFERSSAGAYYATIPADAVGRPGVEYYITGVRRGGGEVLHFASAAWPHEVRVEPPRRQRWIEVERRRLGDRTNRVAAHLEGQDFGGVHTDEQPGQPKLEDRFVRGEIEWSHRLVSALYSITLGYGFLEGETPEGIVSADESLPRRARYGYGGVRLRLHRSIWLDARAIMGFGRYGFLAGAGGQLILGRDWRSCVILGAEWTDELDAPPEDEWGDLGPQGWFRLQWDTVPPFLMGATVKVTKLPSVRLEESGTSVAWDLTYPVTRSLSLTGQISYGARGNRPGGIGGGIGTSFEF